MNQCRCWRRNGAARESVSIHLDFNSGFRRITPNGLRTSNPEAKPTHGRVPIKSLLASVKPAIFVTKIKLGQITAKRALSRRAAAMDDYSDIDVIL